MAAFLTPLVVYIPAYYAGEMGLGLATVGLIFGLTKLWDIVTDPIAGSITERLGPVDGKWRFWLMISLPLMLLGVYRIFLPPEHIGWPYFALWMLLLYVGWTLLTIAHISWGVELSRDYHGRARVAAYRQFAALIGGLLVVLIPVVSDQFAGFGEAERIRNIGLFVLITLPILAVLVIHSTPIGSSQLRVKHDHRWRDSLTVLVHNKSLRALLLGNMGILLGISASSSTLLFYVESALRLGEWATFSIIPLLFSGILFLPGLKWLTTTIGKHRTFRLVLLFQIAVQPLFLFLPAENLLLTVAAFMLMGAVFGTAIFLPLAMIADLKDVKTGNVEARTGIYVALLQSASKVSSALAVALMFLLLPLTGFDPEPGAVNSPETIKSLRYMITILPAMCYAMGWFAMRNYEKPRSIQVAEGDQT